MRYFQSLDIERFVNLLIYNDREIGAICSSWEIEKEEICELLHKHFQQLGIFSVAPFTHADIIRGEIVNQLHYSPEIKMKRAAIQRDIARARERSRSRGTL